MNQTHTQALQKHLGRLFSESLKVSHPVAMLHLIREKMNARSCQRFDQEDILQELGQLQHNLRELNSEMLRIHELLKDQS